MALSDQFEHGRLPLKPLPYENSNLAQKGELMVDSTGDNPSYHLYIADPGDENTIIDITAFMVREAFGSSITVHIDGIEEPMTLHDLMNFIYKRFVYPNDPNGFDYDRDADKLVGNETKKAFLRDTDGEHYFPVTRIDAIYDLEGHSLEDRLAKMSRVGFAEDYAVTAVEDQSTLEIIYPFLNYPNGGNYMQLRIGTTYLDKSRYMVTDKRDENGDIYGADIIFFNDKFEAGRRIDILFIYNTIDTGVNKFTAISGGQIANFSIPTSKMEKVSNGYMLNDPTSIASSKALFDLANDVMEVVAGSQNTAIFAVDTDTTHINSIVVDITSSGITSLGSQYRMLSVVTGCAKAATSTLKIIFTSGASGNKTFNINIPGGVGEGRLIRFLFNNSTCKVIGISAMHPSVHRYIHTCIDQENLISFHGLSYDNNCLIKVYRNGVRLFQDVDYTMALAQEKINLYVRAEEGERIIFEAEYISY